MDLIVIAIILLILGLAISYIVKAKRSGLKCIGCALSKTCSGNCDNQSEKLELADTKACNGNCLDCTSCNHK